MKINLNKIRENAYPTICVILFIAFFCWAFLYATSKEVWYAGMHDSQHEGENCHCYERFMADPNN